MKFVRTERVTPRCLIGHLATLLFRRHFDRFALIKPLFRHSTKTEVVEMASVVTERVNVDVLLLEVDGCTNALKWGEKLYA